ncbi:uncharacterized protein LOC143148174 [Ptiloglossa arizonensis]|uniref:uncharacterized protein LOC143148174 n=1 Tax=Ptiloglossa arizonensis TaxID=3350558 RepID=UPI003FA0894C
MRLKIEKSLVRCTVDLKETDLVHLSQKLNPLECLQLVKTAYKLTPLRVERERKKHGVLSKNLSHLPTTSNECLVNLEQWNNDFSKSEKSGGRSIMEITLRRLGRPDLAKYVRDRRSIKFLDKKDYEIADTLEFPEHRVSRRHIIRNDKYSSERGKHKKKKRGHREHSSATSNKGTRRIVVVGRKEAAKRKVYVREERPNKSQIKSDHPYHRSICLSILFLLLFIILCIAAAFFLRRRSLLKTRDKEDKDTLTDPCEWKDEAFCSCSDIEGGCTGKCVKCSPDHQIPSDVLNQCVNSVCVQKSKDRKRKKRQRFSFLQKNIQDKKKEKDQENQDMKKTLEKRVVKKREKLPSIFQRNHRQCACCRCNLTSILQKDKVIREKKENEKRKVHKLKPKKRKEKRRKEEVRKPEKYENVCFSDICK